MLQLGMDGPNVNWSFFEKTQKQMKEEFNITLLNIGSCGLHTVHNAFKAAAGVTDWNIGKPLSSLYILFEDIPTRREDYEKESGVNLYPLQYCSHRWVENATVFNRTIEVLPHVLKYVEGVKDGHVKNPKTKSYKVVCSVVEDCFTVAKLAFFSSVAKQLNAYLKLFQTSWPMIPFLCEDLMKRFHTLMKRFIKKEVLTTATTTSKLASITVADSHNHQSPQKVDVGFSAD